MVMDVVSALRRVVPVDLATLPGQDEDIEFRVPVELLDCPGFGKKSKNVIFGYSSPAEIVCR